LPRKKLLITGASGLLGYALCCQALSAYDVFGVCYKGGIPVEGVTSIRANLTDKTQLTKCFNQVQPQAVIHVAALSQPNDCEQQPGLSKQINLQATIEIARLCSEQSIPLVFTSSDLVFDGRNPPHAEEDPVSPICVYGKQKAEAETSIREIYPEATICRMPLMLGFAPGTGSGFLGHMVRTLAAKQPLSLFTDEFRTPVDTESAAAGLVMALDEKGVLLHLGGPRRLSRFTMGCFVADILRVNHELLKPIRVEDLPMPAPRSPDVSLSSERARILGYVPKELVGFLEKSVPQITNSPGNNQG